MELIPIIMLASLLFFIYPAIMTRYAVQEFKLGVFVSSIFTPLFSWIILYLAMNGFFVVTRGTFFLESSLAIWLGVYIVLQVAFIFALKKLHLINSQPA